MQQPSEQVQESRVAGVDETAITKEQLAAAVANLSSVVSEFVNVANVLLNHLVDERKANKDAPSE